MIFEKPQKNFLKIQMFSLFQKKFYLKLFQGHLDLTTSTQSTWSSRPGSSAIRSQPMSAIGSDIDLEIRGRESVTDPRDPDHDPVDVSPREAKRRKLLQEHF